ncbi:hypothetical protein CYMTET_30031, partial [Cymbomonas tetramitiformis]
GYGFDNLSPLRHRDTRVSRASTSSPLAQTCDRPGCEEKVQTEVHVQQGVLRTNCIDCLDRTNVAQFALGMVALGQQLYALGLSDTPKIALNSGAMAVLMDMYQSMGDILALQYGGSEAHNKVFAQHRGKWKSLHRSQEFITSMRRFYNNTYTDAEKQDAINLFLGHFVPEPGKPALWDLESDCYLHYSPHPPASTVAADEGTPVRTGPAEGGTFTDIGPAEEGTPAGTGPSGWGQGCDLPAKPPRERQLTNCARHLARYPHAMRAVPLPHLRGTKLISFDRVLGERWFTLSPIHMYKDDNMVKEAKARHGKSKPKGDFGADRESRTPERAPTDTTVSWNSMLGWAFQDVLQYGTPSVAHDDSPADVHENYIAPPENHSLPDTSNSSSSSRSALGLSARYIPDMRQLGATYWRSRGDALPGSRSGHSVCALVITLTRRYHRSSAEVAHANVAVVEEHIAADASKL